MTLGHNDQALPLLSSAFGSSVEQGSMSDRRYGDRLAEVLRNMGKYEEAIEVRTKLAEVSDDADGYKGRQIGHVAICHALMGNRDAFDPLFTENKKHIDRSKIFYPVWCYRHLLHGDTVNVDALKGEWSGGGGKVLVPEKDDWHGREVELIIGQYDLLMGVTDNRARVMDLLEMRPNDRELWVIFDAYERLKPSAEASFFYESLAWLHGDDPDVKECVSDFRDRVKEGKAKVSKINSRDLLARLSDYEPLRWPLIMRAKPSQNRRLTEPIPYGAVAIAARDLLKKRDVSTATTLVLKYGHYASETQQYSEKKYEGYFLRVYCNHLLHLIEQESGRSRR
jgi:hypothetical protein